MKTLALAILALEANPSIYASDGTLNYMPIFKIIIAVYLLYVAVLGRGKILENKHLKIEEKKFRSIMRAVALAGAVFTLGNSAIEFFLYDNATFKVVGSVFMGAGTCGACSHAGTEHCIYRQEGGCRGAAQTG